MGFGALDDQDLRQPAGDHRVCRETIAAPWILISVQKELAAPELPVEIKGEAVSEN